ncbi:MAG: hypothetical protein KDD40_03440 [Bdellovibrionales bacterium]|nr:hypothetical protein [Bdellovibrionales bacterium]
MKNKLLILISLLMATFIFYSNLSMGSTLVSKHSFVSVSFGISYPYINGDGNFVYLPSGQLMMNHLEFQFSKKNELKNVRETSLDLCQTYVHWVEAGRDASPTQTVMAVFVLLLDRTENGEMILKDMVKFPRAKTPFNHSYDPFESVNDCATKIAEPLIGYSQYLE